MEIANSQSESLMSRIKVRSREIRTELFRKSIHLMVGTVPLLARLDLNVTISLLAAGIIVYAWAEWLRLNGRDVPLISEITRLASRDRDRNKLVLGPITLAMGALLCLLLYPNPAATIGIYALAFGDGLSSVVGKIFGRIKLPLTGGKTLEGSLTAFTVIFLAVFAQTNNVRPAVTVAAAGTILEALPLEDLDNLVIPLGVGLAVVLFV